MSRPKHMARPARRFPRAGLVACVVVVVALALAAAMVLGFGFPPITSRGHGGAQDEEAPVTLIPGAGVFPEVGPEEEAWAGPAAEDAAEGGPSALTQGVAEGDPADAVGQADDWAPEEPPESVPADGGLGQAGPTAVGQDAPTDIELPALPEE